MSLLCISFRVHLLLTQDCVLVDCCGKGQHCTGICFWALSLGAAACRDCRGLLPLLRNAVCVLLVQTLGGLRVQPAGNCSTEVTVNKSPALTSVSCNCFQIRGLVSRSNTSGFYSLPLIFQSETSDLVHPAQDPKICLQSLVSVIFCSSELLFWRFTKVICIIHC